MSENNRKVGAEFEHIAGRYLEQQGVKIISYNWYCRSGEIDIIGLDGDTYVFCEVKYKKTLAYGHPLEAVTRKKQEIIYRCANVYLTQLGKVNVPCRFDVVGILGEAPYEITHIKNAFAL